MRKVSESGDDSIFASRGHSSSSLYRKTLIGYTQAPGTDAFDIGLQALLGLSLLYSQC